MRTTHSLTANAEDEDNNGDVYDFLMRIVYFNLYSSNTFQAYCKKYQDQPNMVECPQDNYIEFSRRSSVTCEDFLIECTWMGVPFDCCQYFRPLRSTYGPCFMLNSIQAAVKYEKRISNSSTRLVPICIYETCFAYRFVRNLIRHGPHWLDTTMDTATGAGQMRIGFSKSARVCILNEEQAPNLLFSRLHFELRNRDTDMHAAISLQTVENDAGVRAVALEKRNCKFPDEMPSQSSYPYYSFVTCIADCLREAQVRVCGCAHHYMTANRSQQCNYAGLVCLDEAELVFPRANVLQPWNRFFEDRCACLPSCTDNEIKTVALRTDRSDDHRKFTVRLIGLPTQRYLRQRNKDAVDYVGEWNGTVYSVRNIPKKKLHSNIRQLPSAGLLDCSWAQAFSAWWSLSTSSPFDCWAHGRYARDNCSRSLWCRIN